ncbi:MAG: hypothetical protein DWQ30_23650 [Acidobacteria bacterium]|nr:MAG: hypothetical protein DWQ30_23650 [Acidobacteriota bacterium]
MSSQTMQERYDGAAITGGRGAAPTGVPHGDELLAFAEAVVARDERAIEEARERLIAAAGPRATVDAAGVIANFHRMTRIADGTGIPLDERMLKASAPEREALGIDAFDRRRRR